MKAAACERALREEEEEQERQDAAAAVLREKRKRFRLKLEDQKRDHVAFLREQNKERRARKRKELTERLLKQREVEWARQEEKDKRLLKAAEEKAQIMINLRERVRRRQAEQQKQAICGQRSLALPLPPCRKRGRWSAVSRREGLKTRAS